MVLGLQAVPQGLQSPQTQPIPAAALYKRITGVVITPRRNFASVFVVQQCCTHTQTYRQTHRQTHKHTQTHTGTHTGTPLNCSQTEFNKALRHSTPWCKSRQIADGCRNAHCNLQNSRQVCDIHMPEWW